MAAPNAVLMTARSPILPIRGAFCVALTISAAAAARGQGLLMAVGADQGHRDLVGPVVMGGLVLCLVLVIGFYELRIRRIKRGEASKRAELERQARVDKFERLGRLAKELAHELKMPLTAITARAYTLGKLLPPGSEALKDVAVIRGEIKRLDQVMKNFLELLRPGEPRMSNVDAKALVQEVEGLMQAQLEQEGIEFKCEAPQGLTFLADPGQIRQVLINLVKNAAESFDHSGRIVLRAFRAMPSLSADSGERFVWR